MKRGTSIFALPYWRRLSREMKKFQSLDLHSENGRTDLTLRAKRQRATFVRQIAALMAAWFYQEGGQNYVEVELHAPVLNEEIPPDGTRRIGPLILTVQRKEGETPHALRRKAEAERDTALKDVTFYQVALHACQAERADYLQRAEAAEANQPRVIRVYPAYLGGYDPLGLVAAWNARHPEALLVAVDEAYVTCEAYLVTGQGIKTARATLAQLPDRPVIWLAEAGAVAAFADRASFLAGHGTLFAQVFPQKPNEAEVRHVA